MARKTTLKKRDGIELLQRRTVFQGVFRIEQVRLPRGYAVIGDAICSFDPTFGQGISVAALEAVALGEALSMFGPSRLPEALDAYHRILFLAPDSRAATEARERIDFLVRSG